MPTLRLTQSTLSEDRFGVEAALERDGLPRQTATTEFDFAFQDREDLRWYPEDYLQHVADPAPKFAAAHRRARCRGGLRPFQGAVSYCEIRKRTHRRPCALTPSYASLIKPISVRIFHKPAPGRFAFSSRSAVSTRSRLVMGVTNTANRHGFLKDKLRTHLTFREMKYE